MAGSGVFAEADFENQESSQAGKGWAILERRLGFGIRVVVIVYTSRMLRERPKKRNRNLFSSAGNLAILSIASTE